MQTTIELPETIPLDGTGVNADLLENASLDLLRAYQELVQLGVAPAARAYIKKAMRAIADVKGGSNDHCG